MQKYATPERTQQQRIAALQNANRIRTARAEWKKAAARGQATPSPRGLLIEPPAEFENMKVFDVLMAMPKVGRVRAQRWMRSAGVSASKTVKGLSVRQRAELLALMPRSAGSRGTVRP